MTISTLETTLVGVAGEYSVAAELSLRGLMASITLRNSRGIDIIASNSSASKSVSIQVKSNKSGKPSWILNKKSEDFFSENHFYIFVALQGLCRRSNFYIVPSKVIATHIFSSHATWLSGKKKDGSERKDSSMRKFADLDGLYKEKWGLLGLDL